MSDRGYRGMVDVARVGKYRALRKQPRDAAVIVSAEAQQVVVAKLIDHNGQHQLWFLGFLLGYAGQCGEKQQQKEQAGAPARRFGHNVWGWQAGQPNTAALI